jgi:hypothetical protein
MAVSQIITVTQPETRVKQIFYQLFCMDVKCGILHSGKKINSLYKGIAEVNI